MVTPHTDPQPGVEPGEVEEYEGRAVAVQGGVPGAVQRHPGHQLVTRADQVHPSLTGPSVSVPLSERFLPTLIVFSENHFFSIPKSPVTSHNKDRLSCLGKYCINTVILIGEGGDNTSPAMT